MAKNIIIYDKRFLKNFRERIKGKKSLVKKYKEILQIFLSHPYNPSIKNHALGKKGQKLTGYWSFSITDDVRVIYKKSENKYYFVDVGTHKQVYGESHKYV